MHMIDASVRFQYSLAVGTLVAVYTASKARGSASKSAGIQLNQHASYIGILKIDLF